MSGPSDTGKSRGKRRGAALTLVFGAVIATGAATGTLGGSGEDRARLSVDSGAGVADTDLSRALHDDTLAPEAARELVSRSRDRWASFYTAREYEGVRRTLDGEYVGVGLWVRKDGDGRIEVCRVQKGSPAARGGVEVGDRLRAIDGRRVDSQPVTEVVSLLRGDSGITKVKVGSVVELSLERGRRGWNVTLRRALLTAEDVSAERLHGHVSLIKLGAFTRGAGERVRQALEHVDTERFADHGGGVVLDLRGNSGGLVSVANEVASMFLDGGLVATYDVDGEQRVLFAKPGGDTDVPLVVLVDGGTMSAAELLAGALQDRGRAVLVGARTFGKGSVQEPSTLPDGSVVERTVGRYRTPSGRSVEGTGVQPDLRVSPTAGAKAAERQAVKVLSGLGSRP